MPLTFLLHPPHRCQVAFPVDAASAESEDRTAHDRALKQLVRVASLTRKTFRCVFRKAWCNPGGHGFVNMQNRAGNVGPR